MSVSAPGQPRRPREDEWSQEPHPLRRAERRRQQRLRQRRVALRGAVVFAAVMAIAGAAFVVLRPGRQAPETPLPSGGAAAGPSNPTLAWGVRVGSNAFVTVFSEPPGGAPTAVVIPGDTIVDVPKGPATVGGAVERTGLLVAAVQSTLEHRIGYAVVTDQAGLAALIDSTGGLSIDLDRPVTLDRTTTLGPGPTPFTTDQAVAYLAGGGDDAALRWEDVLGAVLPTASGAVWNAMATHTTDPAAVSSLLANAARADVVELPTAVTGLGRTKDPAGVRQLVAVEFPAAPPLVKTIVLDGVGIKGVATDVVARVAPAGFWVVAEQSMRRFNQDETQVIAATASFVDEGNEVAALLGVGRVYVGVQPTGVADITIVVGKDYVRG